MANHSSTLAWKIPWTGVWWAAVYGVTRSQTQLKQLSSSRVDYGFLPLQSLEGNVKCKIFITFLFYVEFLRYQLLQQGVMK